MTFSHISAPRVMASMVLAALAGISSQAQAQSASSGDLYVLSNQASGNSVLVYPRAPDGTLSEGASFLTGGLGTGSGADPLGSQGSILYQSGYVFAVNAGSNDISVLRAEGHQLRWIGRFPSGGTMPVSLDVRGDLVYVLNAGATPNITGFYFDVESGELHEMTQSQRPLAGGAAAKPAEIHFTPDGHGLIVTEKGTQQIDTYTLSPNGYATGPYAHVSSGAVPFGFSVTRRGYALVTEAGSGSVSSYDINDDGSVRLVSGSLALGQQAVCWLISTPDGRFAYTANAGSNTLSGLSVAPDGRLSLLNVAAGTPTTPLDLAMTHDGSLLYARDGNGGITGFHVESDGSLSAIGTVGGVPAGSQGISVR